MRVIAVAAFALIIAACSHSDEVAKTTAPKPGEQIATLPPLLFQDCVAFSTLDDACTAAWYQCRLGTTDNASCVHQWEECCTLRGQGNRSRLASVEPVDR
jgi:hypothetical protein